jgi:hypothetical protein
MLGSPFAGPVSVPFALLSTALSHPRLPRSTLSPSMALFDECDIVDDDLLSTAFDEAEQHMQLPYQGGAPPLVSQHGGPAVGMKRDAPWHPDSAPPGCVCARQGDKQLVGGAYWTGFLTRTALPSTASARSKAATAVAADLQAEAACTRDRRQRCAP